MFEREKTQEEKRQKLEREQIVRSYKKIFDSPDGKIVLLDIMRVCHIASDTTFNATNSRIQDFSEGQRFTGNYIVRMSQVDLVYIDELRRMLRDELNDGK